MATLLEIQQAMNALRLTIFPLKSRFTRLQREGSDADIKLLKDLTNDFTTTVEKLENYQAEMFRKFAEEIDMDKETKQFDETITDFTDIIRKLKVLIGENEFYHFSTTLEDELSIIEESLEEDAHATYHDEVKTLSEQMEKLSYYASFADGEFKTTVRGYKKRYMQIKAKVEARADDKVHSLRALSEHSGHSSSTTDLPADKSNPKSNVRLPKLDLPTFDGDRLNWPLFWEQFSVTIDTNSSLSDQEKLSYLRLSMKDPTAQKIVSPLTGGTHNYTTILQLLKDTFEDHKKIFMKHLNNLLEANTAKLKYEDVVQLKATWERNLTGLERTGMFDLSRFLTAIAVHNMSPEIRVKWADYIEDVEGMPPIETFKSFLSKLMTKLAESDMSVKKPVQQHSSNAHFKPRVQKASIHLVDRQARCVVCNDSPHPLYFCPTFRQASVDRRQELVRQHSACTNCLATLHKYRECKSTKRCRQCNGRHHTMLHFDRNPTAAQPTGTQPTATQPTAAPATTETTPSAPVFTAKATGNQSKSGSTLLMTAVIPISNSKGQTTYARALIDPGASISLLSQKIATQLGLPKDEQVTWITGVMDSKATPSKYCTQFQVKCKDSNEPLTVRAHLVDHIVHQLPSTTILGAEDWQATKNLALADPKFYQPGRIDVLLGVDIWSEIYLPHVYAGAPSEPKAFQTRLGWVLGGLYQGNSATSNLLLHITTDSYDNLDSLLRRFWELEEIPTGTSEALTSDDQLAIQTFQQSVVQTPQGRYQVSLPKKPDAPQLGESRTQALRRLQCTERSLQRRDAWEPFKEAVLDYIKQDHAEAIPADQLDTRDVFYLPMHGVMKSSSTSTKLRIVFDASAPSTTGLSLNDILLSGPNVYPTINHQILKFRQHTVAMSADISQMFRQILLADKDKDLHRFLFRESEQSPVKEYRMKRLTFGVTSSPFIATETIRQVARDHAEQFPLAADVVLNDFYVDDVLTGSASLSQALLLRSQLNDLLESGGFLLRKWRSNSEELLQSVPSELRETEPLLELSNPREHLKTLGIHWDAHEDTFYVAAPEIQAEQELTKRKLAANIAKIYDIMGWISPAVLFAKCLLQQTWETRLDWDEPVPDSIRLPWEEWSESICELAARALPRCYYNTEKEVRAVQLHGFSDASEKGYAAVVYIRAIYSDASASLSLATSKTRVAPAKRQTIPKLELCGALLLAKLLDNVRDSLGLHTSQLWAWTDSQIVLAWLDGNVRKLPVFVANRVGQIRELLPPTAWRHIPSKWNPADCSSRGMLPKELLNHQLWWDGPPWLLRPPTEWPVLLKQSSTDLEDDQPVLLIQSQDFKLIDRCSTLNKLKRVLAWVFRFLHNCKEKNARDLSPTLRVCELEFSLHTLVHISQFSHFAREISHLQSGHELDTKSKLIHLQPFLDDKGTLRVGGRLQKSYLKTSQKHPIILPNGDKLSRLVLQDIHLRSHHAGPQTMLNIVSSLYFVFGCKGLARSVYRKCVTCLKSRARTYNQVMGQLPTSRLKPGHIFHETGVDYAGPIMLKLGRVRKPVLVKAYICVFVCMTVKAVHLELVSDATTVAFLAALKRFVSRRGLPRVLHSDHGSNFVGADRQLKDLTAMLKEPESHTQIVNYCSNNHIKWEYIPERAPNFGGLWEATVKATKKHLNSVTNGCHLTFEEASTILAQIEAILNSRPLTPLYSQSQSGLEALTPGHFLVGQPLLAVPEDDVSRVKGYLRQWNLCQRIIQDYWKRWSVEYLLILNRHQKWTRPTRNLTVGDIVLVKDQVLFTNKWPLARVVKIFPGDDRRVRVVQIRTEKGLYRRPSSKLVLLLPSEESDEDTLPRPSSGGSVSEPDRHN